MRRPIMDRLVRAGDHRCGRLLPTARAGLSRRRHAAPAVQRQLPQSAGGDAAFLRADRQARRAGRGQRLCLARRAAVVSPFFADPFFGRFFGDQDFGPPASGSSARSAPACWSIRRASSSPISMSSPMPTRSRSRCRTGANSTARSCSRTSAPTSPCSGSKGATGPFPTSISAIPTRSRSATWCSPSAIPSASARRRPAASSRRWPARKSASPTSSSSSRPTPPSIPAIPAAP